MRRCIPVLVAVLVSACVAGLPAIDAEEEAAELMRISREWSDVAATGDIDAILAGWAEDAIMMAPGQPPIRGKAAIRAYIESTGSIPGFSVRWEPLEAHLQRPGTWRTSLNVIGSRGRIRLAHRCPNRIKS